LHLPALVRSKHYFVYIAPQGLDGVVFAARGLKPRAIDTLPLRGTACLPGDACGFVSDFVLRYSIFFSRGQHFLRWDLP
jgi:hypothetical protein